MAQVQIETEDFVQPYQDVADGESTYTTDAEYDAWFRRNVEAGLQDIREGRVVSDEEAQEEVDALYRQLTTNLKHK